MLRQTLRRLHFPGITRLKPALGALAAFAAAALLLSAPAARAQDGGPMDALRQGIEQGLELLRHPGFAAEEQKPRQLRRLEELFARLFDFEEFSRRVLAENWTRFTPAQRAEFVGVFSAFLKRYYLPRLQARYTDESAVVRGQEMIAADRAAVKVAVLWNGREIPVEVRMHRRGAVWRAYDLSVVGVSGAQLYRAQLREILRRSTPAETIELIRRRIEEE